MRTGLGSTSQKMKSATLARSGGSVPAFRDDSGRSPFSRPARVLHPYGPWRRPGASFGRGHPKKSVADLGSLRRFSVLIVPETPNPRGISGLDAYGQVFDGGILIKIARSRGPIGTRSKKWRVSRASR